MPRARTQSCVCSGLLKPFFLCSRLLRCRKLGKKLLRALCVPLTMDAVVHQCVSRVAQLGGMQAISKPHVGSCRAKSCDGTHHGAGVRQEWALRGVRGERISRALPSALSPPMSCARALPVVKHLLLMRCWLLQSSEFWLPHASAGGRLRFAIQAMEMKTPRDLGALSAQDCPNKPCYLCKQSGTSQLASRLVVAYPHLDGLKSMLTVSVAWPQKIRLHCKPHQHDLPGLRFRNPATC